LGREHLREDGELRIHRGAPRFDLTGVYPPDYLERLDAEDEAALKYVLDADVLIGEVDESDPHHAQARELFLAWHEQGDSTLISVVNFSLAETRKLRPAARAVERVALGCWDLKTPLIGAQGAIAQLGERLDRTQEVASSSLASSIPKDPWK
jgi:predicted nucleic acid-binding protein